MYNTLIFDFGRVIIDFNADTMTSPYIKNKADIEIVSNVVFDRCYWKLLDSGSISDEEVKAGICSRLPQRLWYEACRVYDNWYFHLPMVEGVYELICDIKKQGSKLYLLSNIGISFVNNYKKVPEINRVLSLFDGLVFSGPLHMVKPEQDIFLHLIKK